jgi:hypothetical protein
MTKKIIIILVVVIIIGAVYFFGAKYYSPSSIKTQNSYPLSATPPAPAPRPTTNTTNSDNLDPAMKDLDTIYN